MILVEGSTIQHTWRFHHFHFFFCLNLDSSGCPLLCLYIGRSNGPLDNTAIDNVLFCFGCHSGLCFVVTGSLRLAVQVDALDVERRTLEGALESCQDELGDAKSLVEQLKLENTRKVR